jgi:uncharacterized repeat protein (TIGR03803 family)
VQGIDGNLYGTTSFGGPSNAGIIFKIDLSGTLTTLYSFCSQPNCADGGLPPGGLIQATDGNFYGTTTLGGGNDNCPNPIGYGCGAVFKMTPQGTLTTLYSFCSQPSCADGVEPEAGLVQAADGNFYGTTSAGGGGNCSTWNGPGCGTVFSLSGPGPSPLQFVGLFPCRVVDTRNPDGQLGGPAIQGGATGRSFPIPQGGCNVPSSAFAYSLNVTVVPHGPLGYLTVWPTGKAQPFVSTMNSPDGRVKANAAIVSAGPGGAVSVYATDTTDVILDIDGYFAPPGSGTYQFYPQTPCRVVDTRGAHGDLGGPYLQAGQERDFPVMESPCLQEINNPQGAYSFNFTVVPHPAGQQLGYLTVWPAGESQPMVSTLNNPRATVVANAAIVPAEAHYGGAIAVYASNDTDLIIDINGFFAAAVGGLSLYPATPCRVLDTRQAGNGRNGQPFSGTLTPPVNVVGSVCAPPSSAQAYIFNATVVPSGSLGYLTLWPDGSGQPAVSTLNALDGFITSNMAIVPTTNGSIDAYAYGLTQLILDISGYFAP